MIDKIQLTATEHPLITLTNNKLDKTDNYWRVYYTRQGAGVLYEAVGGCIIRGRDYLSFASTCGHRRFLMESVLLIVFVSCVVYISYLYPARMAFKTILCTKKYYTSHSLKIPIVI